MLGTLRALKSKYTGDTRKIETLVPAEARAIIEQLLRKPKLLPPALVNEIVQQEAMEQLISEVLADALTELMSKVNPLTIDIGLPIMLKKALSGVKAEFDRRVEPEIRRFLPVIARQALKRGGAFLLAHQDDPAFVTFRLKILAWVLDQPINELLPLVDDQALEATALIADHVLKAAAS